jgi:spoIIIJ-associated protein
MEHHERVTTTIRTILTHLGVTYEDVCVETDDRTHSVRYVVATNESALLIGEHGARLLALNHLVKRMLEREMDQGTLAFTIDVNDYQKRRIEEIRTKARILAERARFFRSTVEMDPMSSYERMVVHSEFADTPDIETESAGSGKDRHIVLRFVESKPLL